MVRPDASGQALRLFGPEIDSAGYGRSHALYAVVRDGRVTGWINPTLPPNRQMAPHETTSAYLRRMLIVGHDPFLSVAPGRLPLSDGDGFLDRRPDLDAPENAVATRICEPSPVGGGRGSLGFDEAGFLQGLALLPFAVGLPALNAERRQAMVNGPALYAQLHLGDVITGGSAAFVRSHHGVRRYADRQDSGYEVLVINMGAQPSNNLSRMNSAALVGVRDGRIVWLADGDQASELGLTTALCIDRRSRAARVRPGCTEFAFYSP